MDKQHYSANQPSQRQRWGSFRNKRIPGLCPRFIENKNSSLLPRGFSHFWHELHRARNCESFRNRSYNRFFPWAWGGPSWQSIPGTNANSFLSNFGGAYFAYFNTAGTFLNDLTAVSFGNIALRTRGASAVYYNEFIPAGTGSFQFQSASSGSFTYGPIGAPTGYFSVVRAKSGPVISSVTPLLAGASGRVVQSGTITINGVGFGTAPQCSQCSVLAYPSTPLAVISWSDRAVTALLPTSSNGINRITVNAATGSDYINIMASPPAPSTTSFTIQTNPSGLQFSIDGGPSQQAPQTLTVAANSSHTIAVAQTQPGGAGTQYVFTGWNDGGAASHSITVGTLGLTYAATFKTQFQLTVAATPPGGGTVLPASGAFYDAGSVVPLTAVPSSGYAFSGWTGGVASSNAQSTTVTIGSPQTVTANFTPIGPTINAGGIVPLYSSTPVIQAGSWISVYGSKFVSGVTTWNGDFPASLGGVSVTINNKPGFLWLVSPGQINMQAPDDTATGPVSVVVRTPTGTATSTVTLAPLGPSFCLLSSKYPSAVILTPDGTGAYGGGTYDLLGPLKQFPFATRPVKPGESLVLYGVGFGPTIPAVPAGRAFSGAARTVESVTITIGGVRADVQFSGITTTGLYQFNVIVPSVGSGEQPLKATVAGVQTPSNVFLAVQ